MRGKDNWDAFGAALLTAASKGLTSEQFAKEIGANVEEVRTDVQSWLGKVKAKAIAEAGDNYDMVVAEGKKPKKTRDEYVKGAADKNAKVYTLKSMKGRPATDLGISIELDDLECEE